MPLEGLFEIVERADEFGPHRGDLVGFALPGRNFGCHPGVAVVAFGLRAPLLGHLDTATATTATAPLVAAMIAPLAVVLAASLAAVAWDRGAAGSGAGVEEGPPGGVADDLVAESIDGAPRERLPEDVEDVEDVAASRICLMRTSSRTTSRSARPSSPAFQAVSATSSSS